MSLRQRAVHGVEYLASYTLSRTRSNNLGYYGSGGVAAEGAYWMNAYNPEANYGPAFYDARHNFVYSANYELPFGKGRKWASDASPVMDAIIGGWRLSGILQLRSGFPITVTDGPGRSLQGHAGTSGRTASAIPFRPIRTSPLARHQRLRGAPLGRSGMPGRRRTRARVQEH